MDEIYYKSLIKQYGLWHSPKMLSKILKEAQSYNFCWRKDLKVSIFWKDVAESIGMSENSMSRIVTGKGFPNRNNMNKLIKYFDLTI